MIKPQQPIQLFKVFMSNDAINRTQKVLGSGYIGQGPVVEEFEKQLCDFFGNAHVVTTNSATSSEHLVFHMLKRPQKRKLINEAPSISNHDWPGINEHDHILTTALTCTATNWPILANNISLKWVDADPNTCNMDLDDLERKITEKTKAIVVVHWGGYPLDLDRLAKIQESAFNKYGFMPIIIEDSAHAFGSMYKGKPIGSHGNICTFSFQAIKHLTAGDGGCITFPNEDLVHRAKLLRWFGIDRNDNRKDFRCEADVAEYGFKMHMNDINAAIGLGNLPDVKSLVLKNHKANGQYYNEALKDVNGVKLLENNPDRESAYWLYTLKVERHADFVKKMYDANIMVSRVHERNDIHTCVHEYKSHLPNLDNLVQEMICIPVGWWVTPEEREYIVQTIKSGW